MQQSQYKKAPLNQNDLPRMSPKYISCMMAFKDFLTLKKKNNDDREKFLSAHKNEFNVQLLMEHHSQLHKQKALFNQKYNLFVDRIYGKVSSQRAKLEVVMEQYFSSPRKKRSLNLQELLILEEIKKLKQKERKQNKLLSMIHEDFLKEAKREFHQFTKEELKQIDGIKSSIHNNIVESFYNNESFLNKNAKPLMQKRISVTEAGDITFPYEFYKVLNTVPMNEEIRSKTMVNFKDKPAILMKLESDKKKKVSKLQPESDLLQEEDLSIKNKINKYTKLIENTQKILNDRRSREIIYQQQIDHGYEYLGTQKENSFDKDLEEKERVERQKIISNVTGKVKIVNRFRESIKRRTQTQQSQRISTQLSPMNLIDSSDRLMQKDINLLNKIRSENSLGQMKTQVTQINNQCYNEAQQAGKIIKKCTRFLNRNDSKYNKLVENYNKVFA